MKRTEIQRARITLRGAVQGVGFRPFVYRLATELKLNGWVNNSGQGVFIEIEGEPDLIARFLKRLQTEKPARSVVQSCETSHLDPVGYDRFEIRQSSDAGDKTALILPDIATCDDCQRDMFDSGNRRFRYPFTNCTNCGPRFSIIEALPYDRASTSMKEFTMCAECEREYHDPHNRRFHAQPNACPKCGPQLALWDSSGEIVSAKNEALLHAAEKIRAGKILALKGIGGFQLLVDARNEPAVARLRERKHREEKPFALMSPSLEQARKICEISELEERLLLSPESPIVLLQKQSAIGNQLATGRVHPAGGHSAIAPGNPNLGIMLPYSPLHHLLMRELGFPVVATSGNLSDEPICIEESEALDRLRHVVDFFLVHDRPIIRHMDDSIVREIAGREMVLRRARGYAPLPISIDSEKTSTILALGGHLKNSVALAVGHNVFISQHIGDLETMPAHEAFRKSASDLPQLYETQPEIIACDLHPEYLSTKFAGEIAGSRPIARVQHHWAHIAATMAENGISPPALGISWDGTGYGSDGTIWGGEFLLAEADGNFSRAAHLRTFALPGGNAAVKEPRRSALGVLYEIMGEEIWNNTEVTAQFSATELPPLRAMLSRKLSSPITSSAGRLFDAVASILHLRQRTTFEGQAATALEFAVQPMVTASYPFDLLAGKPSVVDWEPTIRALLADVKSDVPTGMIAAKFHSSLAEMMVAVAQRFGQKKIVLGGGCFQNRYLTERTIQQLRESAFEVFWPQRVPPNDGGIALGQVAAVRMRTDIATNG